MGSLEAEAAEWVICLGEGNVSEARRTEFQSWIDQGPLYRDAFEFASKTWSELGLLTPSDIEELELADTGDVLARNSAVPASRAKSFKRRFTRIALSLFLVVMAGLGGFTFWYGNPVVVLQADYRADTGSMRTVALPDGSRVDLASGSAIALDYSAADRQVRLLSGKAYFVVAPRDGEAETRPFSVRAGEVTVTALGTEFVTDLDHDAVEVAVTEHEVQVEESSGAGVRLSEGQVVTFQPEQGFSAVRDRLDDFALAWRKGLLVFNNRPLGEVVAEINRHRHGRIVVRSDGLAQLRVSGVFDANDPDDALSRIVSELNLSVISIPPLVSVIF